MAHDLETSKQNAIAFYRTAYLGDPSAALADYLPQYRCMNRVTVIRDRRVEGQVDA